MFTATNSNSASVAACDARKADVDRCVSSDKVQDGPTPNGAHKVQEFTADGEARADSPVSATSCPGRGLGNGASSDSVIEYFKHRKCLHYAAKHGIEWEVVLQQNLERFGPQLKDGDTVAVKMDNCKLSCNETGKTSEETATGRSETGRSDQLNYEFNLCKSERLASGFAKEVAVLNRIWKVWVESRKGRAKHDGLSTNEPGRAKTAKTGSFRHHPITAPTAQPFSETVLTAPSGDKTYPFLYMLPMEKLKKPKFYNDLDKTELMRSMRELLRQLRFLHTEVGLVHGDIKLENIMLREVVGELNSGEMKSRNAGEPSIDYPVLVDFNTARNLNTKGQPSGTVFYFEPSFCKASLDRTKLHGAEYAVTYSRATDLFALGISFLQMIVKSELDQHGGTREIYWKYRKESCDPRDLEGLVDVVSGVWNKKVEKVNLYQLERIENEGIIEMTVGFRIVKAIYAMLNPPIATRGAEELESLLTKYLEPH